MAKTPSPNDQKNDSSETQQQLSEQDSNKLQQQLSEQEQAERRNQLEMTMSWLLHASSCQNEQCPSTKCGQVKALFSHRDHCPQSIEGGCQLCRRIWLLTQMHAKDCTNINCSVPRCRELRVVRMRNARAGAPAGETAGTAAEEAAPTDVTSLQAAPRGKPKQDGAGHSKPVQKALLRTGSMATTDVPHDQKKGCNETTQHLSEQEQAEREELLEKALASLVHASSCQNQSCPSTKCGQVKAAFSHRNCHPHRRQRVCQLCRCMWLLLEIHAKDCSNIKCPEPRCRELRLVRNVRAGAPAGESEGTAAEGPASTNVASLQAAPRGGPKQDGAAHFKPIQNALLRTGNMATTDLPHDQKKGSNERTQQQVSEEEQAERKKLLEKTLASLVHASSCQNQSCPSTKCGQVKAAFSHRNRCPNSGCQLCRRMGLLLQTHAKGCTNTDCPVPCCRELRNGA